MFSSFCYTILYLLHYILCCPFYKIKYCTRVRNSFSGEWIQMDQNHFKKFNTLDLGIKNMIYLVACKKYTFTYIMP